MNDRVTPRHEKPAASVHLSASIPTVDRRSNGHLNSKPVQLAYSTFSPNSNLLQIANIFMSQTNHHHPRFQNMYNRQKITKAHRMPFGRQIFPGCSSSYYVPIHPTMPTIKPLDQFIEWMGVNTPLTPLLNSKNIFTMLRSQKQRQQVTFSSSHLQIQLAPLNFECGLTNGELCLQISHSVSASLSNKYV